MKIKEIRGYHVGFPLQDPIGNALVFFHKREFLLVEIVTDSGISGWGEVNASPHAAAALIRTRFAPLVLGQPVADMGRLWHLMSAAMHYDRRGAAAMAIAGLDMALHDAAAREQGVSIASMLGGALRDRVFAYASGPFIRQDRDPYGRYLHETETYLQRNFRAVKPRCGVDPRLDGEMAMALRRLLGSGHGADDGRQSGLLGLCGDRIRQAHGRGEPALAGRARAAGRHFRLPDRPARDEYRDCRRRSARQPGRVPGFPLAGTFSLIQPDLTVCGGFTGLRRIAALADAFEIPVMPHVFGTVVNFYASLQMAALLPAKRGGGPAPYPFVEFDATENPLLSLLGEPQLNPDGTFDIPAGPGLGIELRAERLAPWLSGHWSAA